jgi:hypothetical protein
MSLGHDEKAGYYLDQLKQVEAEADLLLMAALVHAVLAVNDTLREIGIGPTNEGIASLIYNLDLP